MGKSRLAKMLLERQGIPGISTDALTSTISKLWPETRLRGGVPDDEWEMNFYPFLKRFIEMVEVDYNDYVIEGAVISPKLAEILKENFQTRAVFIGNSEITLDGMQQHMGRNDWLNKVDQEELAKIPERIVAKSRRIEEECQQFGFPYVDLADDFEEKVELAYNQLVFMI